MPKRVFKMPINLEINRLRNIYGTEISKLTNVNEEQKANFFNLVVPSLADPQIIADISQMPRYICNFEQCKSESKSFSSKQKFIQHLKILHDQELPAGCNFLYPNDKATVPGGFWCSICGHHYCRRDHLQNHIRTNSHCKNGNVSLINPLVMKELQVEEHLALEAPSIPKSEKFEFKPKNTLLAIEWIPIDKSNDQNSNQNLKTRTITDCIKKITKSLSMFSISRKKSCKIEKKSNTFQNIFSISSVHFASNLHPIINPETKRKLDDDEFEQVKTKKLLVIREDLSDEEDQLLINSLNSFENKNLN